MPGDRFQIAENWAAHVPLRAGEAREVTARFVFTSAAGGSSVVRPRIEPGAVEAAVEEARGLARRHAAKDVTWWCGPAAQPQDLPERLRALGFVPDEEAPLLTTMSIERRPNGDPAVEVRRVETLEDYVAALAIDWEAWNMPEEERARRRERAPADWESEQAGGLVVNHVAYLHGEPAAFARTVFLDGAALLLGGATRIAARGHGCYTSLVHRRWEEAAERGTPALVVAAGAMSGPVLARLGFDAHGEVHLLVDRL